MGESESAPAASDDPLSSESSQSSAHPAPVHSDLPANAPHAVHGADCAACAADHGKVAVDLLLETHDLKPSLTPWLADQLQRLTTLAGVTEGAVTVVVVDDVRMSELHSQYHDDPSTTDVLTFDLRDDADAPLEGDLVLCLDEAQRQAAQRGHAVRMELLLYALHGLLHLLGYDDHDPADSERMHRREDELLVRAGFEPVYAGGSQAPRGRDG